MPGSVWIIDSEHWPRAYLRAELIERGHDAVGFAALAEALVRLALRGRRPELVVVDLDGEGIDPRALDILFRAGLRVVGIGGAAAWETEARRVPSHPWAGLLRRPLTIGDVADAVERQLAARAPGPSLAT